MVELGVVLAVVGVALLVAEAHVPGGVLGVTGGATLALGLALALAGAGGAVGVIVGVVLGTLVASGLWLAIATRKALATRRLRSASGREALAGRCGVVRRWQNGDGQVFVDGALWRARPSWPDADEQLEPGDTVVVEGMSGLTLAVRRAEEWEES
ncbi:MAG TPA: NfeD family protein [Thermoleophilaceae bacterium]|nr:NfeD family protein [Thermoleophilaceae bacterium]